MTGGRPRSEHDPPSIGDADRRQLDRVVALVREVLGPDGIGGYLFGSATLDGLRPQSDLDVLVLSTRRTRREEKQRLVKRLLAISDRSTPQGRRRRVELTIVARPDITPWRHPPRFDFQYGDWLRTEFERGDVEPWPSTTSPDLAVLVTMVLLAKRPLFGPDPNEVFDPVPRGDLIDAMVGGIDGLLDDLDEDTTNVVLTLARIWSTVSDGVVRSKDAAAAWSCDRLPDEHRAVLARARAIYVGAEPEGWTDLRPRVRPLADRLVAEIHAQTA